MVGSMVNGRGSRTGPRLSADAWEQAAFELMAQDGLETVSVEPLARALNVTKGSFYWHFENRDALVAAALRRWRRQSIDDVIEELNRIADPRARLRALVGRAIREPHHGRLELTIAGHSREPLVAAA